jgi:hypothetical protein
MTAVPPSPNDAGASRRVRLEGVLWAVQMDGGFTLRLPDGRPIPGSLVGRPIAGLARVLGRPLIVFGSAQFGSVGEVERIEADGFLPNDGKPWVISPNELPLSQEVAKEMADRLQSVRGAWPGDETDEQIEQALRELS